jgi:putative ABC transport system substrate-binding protein
MKRRAFITLLGGAAVAWPLKARAQHQSERMRRIGILIAGAQSDPNMQERVAAFLQALEKLGWSEGHNVQIDIRFAEGRPDQYEPLAKELTALKPDVTFAYATPIAAALQRESRTIPIVFVNVSDPIGSGLVASLARPGGNLTGLMLYEEGITGKWLALLKEIAPQLQSIALMANPRTMPTNTISGRPRRRPPHSESRLCLVRSPVLSTLRTPLSLSCKHQMAAWWCCRTALASCIVASS